MQIYGSGFLAKNLKKINIPNKFFVYAAGVSNSNLKNKKEFLREINQFKKILNKINPKKTFVYISSLSVENKSLKKDPYVQNKIKIEKILKKKFKNYLIVRLPQIVGKNSNKNTLTNAINESLLKHRTFTVWKGSKRNLIDIADIKFILKKLFNTFKENKKVINIFNQKSIDIVRLLKIFSGLLQIKISIKIIKKNNKNINLKNLKKDTLLPKDYYKRLKKRDYIEKIIRKYY